ncbi:MAG: phosphatidate cytidylyltransferase [Bacteroidetes bacterium]|nr:MAG: phosphatidate cytidylyltransferase [Bacteroidota bacterium]
MALNKAVFKTRALTALVFVAVMLCGLLLSTSSFFVLFSIIHFGCWAEYLTLLQGIYRTRFHRYFGWGIALVGYSLVLAACPPALSIGGYALQHNAVLPCSAAGFLLMAVGILRSQQRVATRPLAAAGIGWVYISLAWAAMLSLYQLGLSQQFAGWLYPVMLIAGIWINDTMAYLVGSFVGKTPLSKISPKKTWEGTLGGAALAVAAVAGLGLYGFSIPWHTALAIGTIAAVAGTLGDLLESKLKRLAGVKDSGSIMPGHGGFLDRFDSLLLATPVLWVYLYLAK